ncbi:dTDP-4-dehydrorhamnose 3,5-epimerase [Nonomuraea zeae]|uniref:dTDP-4-dehydrorhamnose 3,5-epimerase n=1 Tax=Nonomuraea zeae TaxID=1642303 RepID=A0A5S4G8F8_9ACTN|nr:dTDP-4-dehydrorhamnose 3,5-epimerase [Nonomuraea zeae]TMR29305.1 dTDP-4-dehydrorhamnose 3,5-epimerase [Nonomuraea zeae]
MKQLSIDGALLYTPRIHSDLRGDFLESFRAVDLREAIGSTLELAQINCSVSRRGVLRGVHFADVPPGQAKYVMCVAGEVLDVVVDVRVGSPTFGQWETVRLDAVTHCGLYLSEGLGHGFLTLSESATVVYACSTGYDPAREHGIHPLDPDLAIDWPLTEEPIMSPKDAAAPTLKQARDLGMLPSC